MCVQVHGDYMETEPRLKEREVPQEMHETLVPAGARAEAGDHRLVVAQAANPMAIPYAPPENPGNEDGQAFFYHNSRQSSAQPAR